MDNYTDMPDFDGENLPVKADSAEPITNEKFAMGLGVDMDRQLEMLKKAAELAPQVKKYRQIIIQSYTNAQDWVKFGKGDKATACLRSSGAMRIVANVPALAPCFRDVHSIKEDILDDKGIVCGYRYIFQGYGEMGGRNVYCIGQYSTKEAFVAKSGGSFKDWREINESHVRQAAHSYFKGNVIKDMLGLKGMPWDEFEQMCNFAGQVASKSSSVEHRENFEGGTSDIDRTGQNALYDQLFLLASENKVVRWLQDGDSVKHWIDEPSTELQEYANKQPHPQQTLAQASLKALRTWVNKEGKLIAGNGDFSTVKARQLKTLTETVIPKLLKDHDDA
jgi:hypothetical protein